VRLALLDHHLANFHADTFHRLLGSTFADRGVEVVAAFESDPTPGTDWCADHAVARATSLDEAVDRADALLVLAPDDLDTHLDTARRVLPAGKPVVFDKLLALDPAEAWQIVALAEQHGTRIFSGSALRYAAEADRLLDGVDPVRIQDAFARGYGAWDHYGIHTLSLAVRLGGHHITRMRDCGTPDSRLLVLDHGERRTLVDCRTGDNAAERLGWTGGIKVDGQWRTTEVTDANAFYTNLLGHYLDFLAGAPPESSPEELARIVAMLAGSRASLAEDGGWVALDRPGTDPVDGSAEGVH